MSGGEQRRAVVARALINSPRWLLADEPTSDLDEDTEADIIDLLEQLQRPSRSGWCSSPTISSSPGARQRIYEMRQGVAWQPPVGLPVPRQRHARPRDQVGARA